MLGTGSKFLQIEIYHFQLCFVHGFLFEAKLVIMMV